MASSISLSVPAFVDTAPWPGAVTPLRQYVVGTSVLNVGTAAANQIAGGVFPGGGAMAVSAGSGLNVTVAAGYCCVPAASALQGGYVFGTMNSQTLSLAAADPTNPRIDLVVAFVSDTGTSSSASSVEVITGTPASSPSAPSAPSPSIILAAVTVPAGSASLTSANITDERSYVVAPGGVLPITSSSDAPAVPATQLMYDIATGTIVQGAGTVASLPVLPWAPVMALATSNVTDSAAKGVLTTIATTGSFTTDGSTDVEIYYKWTGFKVGTAPLLVTVEVQIDSTVVDQVVVFPASTSVFSVGGSARYFTSSGGGGNRPSAGSHTVTLSFQSASSSITTTLSASATAPACVRVSPLAT